MALISLAYGGSVRVSNGQWYSMGVEPLPKILINHNISQV